MPKPIWYQIVDVAALRALIDQKDTHYRQASDACQKVADERDCLRARVDALMGLLATSDARVAELERGEQVWKNLHNALERTASERDHYRAALEEMSQELSHYPEGDGIFGHLKRILRRAILNP